MNGSIRFDSQATVERAIGEIGHKVRSKKAPFANIATTLCERACTKVLMLKYPLLALPSKDKRKETHLFQSFPIKRVERNNPSEYHEHLSAISDYLGIEFDIEARIERWGKCRIPKDITLRSRLSEEAGAASRSSRYFEAQEGGFIIGEALAFYSVPEHDCNLVVYNQLEETVDVLNRWCGKWSEDCEVLETSSITQLVGVWEWKSKVHILRKHAGLEMLDAEEGVEEQEE
jgi:hypothetical protein